MVYIDLVSTRQECLDESTSLEDLCSGGRVSVAEDCISISKECFARCAVVLVLHVSLRLTPGAEGLVESDGVFEEASSMNASECFPYVPSEYCQIFFRWFWKAWPSQS